MGTTQFWVIESSAIICVKKFAEWSLIMLFNSVHFYIFAIIVFPVYFVLPDRAKRWWLLITSLYFYAIFKISLILVLFTSIILTFFAAKGIEANQGKLRTAYLAVAVVGNLLLIYFFKYFDFSIRAVNLFLDLNYAILSMLNPPV